MTNRGEHRAAVRAYVKGLIKKEPAYLGRILLRFVEKWPGSSPGFRWDDFSALYDANEIGALADDYGERASATGEEREAVELFRLVLDRRKKEGSVPEA